MKPKKYLSITLTNPLERCCSFCQRSEFALMALQCLRSRLLWKKKKGTLKGPCCFHMALTWEHQPQLPTQLHPPGLETGHLLRYIMDALWNKFQFSTMLKTFQFTLLCASLKYTKSTVLPCNSSANAVSTKTTEIHRKYLQSLKEFTGP